MTSNRYTRTTPSIHPRLSQLQSLNQLQQQCMNKLQSRLNSKSLYEQQSKYSRTPVYKPLTIDEINQLQFDADIKLIRTVNDTRNNIVHELPPAIVPHRDADDTSSDSKAVVALKHNIHTHQVTIDYCGVNELLESLNTIDNDISIDIHNATHSPHIIPYTQQGNLELYTEQNIALRLSNRYDQRFVYAVQQLWHSLPIHRIGITHTEIITIDTLVQLLILIYTQLCNQATLNVDRCVNTIYNDFHNELNRSSVDLLCLHDILYRITDIWTCDVLIDSYVEFIRNMLQSITVPYQKPIKSKLQYSSRKANAPQRRRLSNRADCSTVNRPSMDQHDITQLHIDSHTSSAQRHHTNNSNTDTGNVHTVIRPNSAPIQPSDHAQSITIQYRPLSAPSLPYTSNTNNISQPPFLSSHHIPSNVLLLSIQPDGAPMTTGEISSATQLNSISTLHTTTKLSAIQLSHHQLTEQLEYQSLMSAHALAASNIRQSNTITTPSSNKPQPIAWNDQYDNVIELLHTGRIDQLVDTQICNTSLDNNTTPSLHSSSSSHTSKLIMSPPPPRYNNATLSVTPNILLSNNQYTGKHGGGTTDGNTMVIDCHPSNHTASHTNRFDRLQLDCTDAVVSDAAELADRVHNLYSQHDKLVSTHKPSKNQSIANTPHTHSHRFNIDRRSTRLSGHPMGYQCVNNRHPRYNTNNYDELPIQSSYVYRNCMFIKQATHVSNPSTPQYTRPHTSIQHNTIKLPTVIQHPTPSIQHNRPKTIQSMSVSKPRKRTYFVTDDCNTVNNNDVLHVNRLKAVNI